MGKKRKAKMPTGGHAIEAVFDGCCEPRNPGGHAAWGALVRVDGEIVWRQSGYCGHGPNMSNNVAEYSGALAALTEAVKYDGVILLRGDSRLVIMQLGPDHKWGNRWKMHGGFYAPYWKQAKALVDQHRHRMMFKWVPREENSDCDELSKKILTDMGVRFRIQPNEQKVVEHEATGSTSSAGTEVTAG